jgi:hypothetical protein
MLANPDAAVDRLVIQASELFRTNRLDEALAACVEATRSRSDAAAAAYIVGARVHLCRGDAQQASRWLAGAPPSHPEAVEVAAQIAQGLQARDKCLAELGRKNSVAALAWASQSIQISPSCASLRVRCRGCGAAG